MYTHSLAPALPTTLKVPPPINYSLKSSPMKQKTIVGPFMCVEIHRRQTQWNLNFHTVQKYHAHANSLVWAYSNVSDKRPYDDPICRSLHTQSIDMKRIVIFFNATVWSGRPPLWYQHTHTHKSTAVSGAGVRPPLDRARSRPTQCYVEQFPFISSPNAVNKATGICPPLICWNHSCVLAK